MGETYTVNWDTTVFLHTGWTARYDGTEAPEGGHAYLKRSVGVEAENFKPEDGWCFGYAPVSRTREGRQSNTVPKANRTLKIQKLGGGWSDTEVDGVTVIWTARHPMNGPVIVGMYDNATVLRFMPPADNDERPFITKARVEHCHLVPSIRRDFQVPQKQRGFPGMAAAWFPGMHKSGPAKDFLPTVAEYLPIVRQYTCQGSLRVSDSATAP